MTSAVQVSTDSHGNTRREMWTWTSRRRVLSYWGRQRIVGVEVVIGTAFRDILFGAYADETLVGNGSGDIIDGRGGDDRLFAGTGKDAIRGGQGDDLIYDTHQGRIRAWGNGGNDVIIGTFANDTIRGGEGRDKIRALAGDDFLDGGPGNDLQALLYAAVAFPLGLLLGLGLAKLAGRLNGEQLPGVEFPARLNDGAIWLGLAVALVGALVLLALSQDHRVDRRATPLRPNARSPRSLLVNNGRQAIDLPPVSASRGAFDFRPSFPAGSADRTTSQACRIRPG